MKKGFYTTKTQFVYRNESDAKEKKNPLFKYQTKIEDVQDGVEIEGVEVKYRLNKLNNTK